MAARKLEVVFVGDTTSFDRATKRIGGGADKTESKLAKLGKAMVGAFAVQKVAQGAKTAINAATDLGEEVSKVGVVFKGSEKGVIKWSKTTASSLGISQRAALEATGVFGNMLVPMGFARKDAAKMSTKMVGLAADMASFNNASPEETLDALRAGLAGESEPLRRFGVFLNDARLKQEALSLGIYKGKGPLDANAKAQATYSLILKDTKDAQGDFTRTSGSLANQQRILKAETENLAAGLGKVLLPAAQKIASVAVSMLKGFQALPGPLQTVISVGGGLAIAFAALALVAGPLATGVGVLAVAFTGLAGVLGVSALALGGIVLAVGAVVVAGVLLIKHWGEVKAVASSAFGAITATVSGAWHGIASLTSDVWGGIRAGLSAYFGAIKTLVTTYFGIYRTIITGAWSVIASATSAAWGGIRTALAAVWSAIKASALFWFGLVSSGVSAVWSAISTSTHTIWDGLRSFLSAAWGGIRTTAATVWDGIRHVVVTPIIAAGGSIREVFRTLKEWLDKKWGDISGAVGGFASDVAGKVGDAFKGAANAVIGFVNKIIDAVNAIPGVPNIGHIKALAEGGSTGKGGSGKNIQALARGGKVNRPTVIMGEEAPRHPEWVIPTNPAYRGRALGLLAKAAGDLGVGGGGPVAAFAQGGQWGAHLSRGQIEQAWVAGGGDPRKAKLMAAIALAESGGWTRRPNSTGSGAFGLWQILGQEVPGDLGNSIVNARNAVWKLQHQGLGAWEAYTNGSYKKYLNGGGGIGGLIGSIGGALGDLLSKGASFILDKLPGIGSLPSWLGGTGKYVLGHVTKWIKDKVKSLVGFGGGGGVGKGVAGSIKGAIAFAKTLGFGMPGPRQLTGGKHAPGSWHYQGRAADFGHAGHSDGQMRQLFSAFLGRYGSHIKELFYDPVGFYIKNGQRVPGAIGGHTDHLHLALAQGGVAPGGWVRVGELGAEWAQLPAGTRVHQASQSTSPPSGGPLIGELHVHGETDPRVLARELAWQVATAR